MKLGDLCLTAREHITGNRQQDYGTPEDNFARIARYWTMYFRNKGLDIIIEKKDVALLMALFKLAREQGNHKDDNLIDAIGYIDIAGSKFSV